MKTSHAVIFDMDGTLFDTGPQFLNIINRLRKARNEAEVSYDSLRDVVSQGSPSMIKKAFNFDEKHPEYQGIYEEFLKIYHDTLGEGVAFFPGVSELLKTLDEQNIPWGIMSNRKEAYIKPFLKKFDLHERSKCFVGADTVGIGKPDPAPLLYCAKLLNLPPQVCFYVGDYPTDVQAANAAQMKSVAVSWGYYDTKTQDIHSWKADIILNQPMDLLKHLN